MSCEFYCKYITFMIIEVLTATSNSSRYVYVKQTFDVWASLRCDVDWILKGWYPISFLKQNNQMIKLEKKYAHTS